MKIKYFIVLGLILSIVVGCSKDDPTSPLDENNVAKKLSMKEIIVPSGLQQSNDPHAIIARANIQLINSFQYYSIYFTPPTGSVNLNKIGSITGEWTKTWNLQNGISVTMEYYENSANFGWAVYLSGSDGEVTFNNFKVLEAQEIIALKEGYFRTFDFESSNINGEWNYSTNTDGTYIVNINAYTTEGAISDHIVLTSSPDNSGEISNYDVSNGQNILTSKVVWTSAGTGQWWEYDEAGNVTSEGSF